MMHVGEGFKGARRHQLSETEREQIENFLSAHGARRYPVADSGDDFNLCVFLRRKGYKVQRHCSDGSRRAPFFIDKRPYSREGFIRFVNRIRARDGLPPVGGRE